jgi:hypothetical protein
MGTPKKQKSKALVKSKGRPKEPISEKVDFEQLTILCAKGFTDKEIAAFYKVDERTITRWKKDEQFMSVLKEGKQLADEKVERSLFERATGYSHSEDKIFNDNGTPLIVPTTKFYPPDTTAAIFWLKNRKPQEWRDKQDIEHSGTINQTIEDKTVLDFRPRLNESDTTSKETP